MPEFLSTKISLREGIVILSAILTIAAMVITNNNTLTSLLPRVQAIEEQHALSAGKYATRDDIKQLSDGITALSRNMIRIGERLGISLEPQPY